MTVQAETNNETEVPAWLNLDGFCPPKVREQLAQAADALEALIAYAEPICIDAYKATELYRIWRAECDIDDIDHIVGGLTGWTRFHEVAMRLEAMGAATGGDAACGYSDDALPEWYESYSDRLHAELEEVQGDA